jgi:outer membrane protein assembly factor BamB
VPKSSIGVLVRFEHFKPGVDELPPVKRLNRRRLLGTLGVGAAASAGYLMLDGGKRCPEYEPETWSYRGAIFDIGVPVYRDGTVFVSVARGVSATKPEGTTFPTEALDSETGETRWSHSDTGGWTPPTLDGGVAYVGNAKNRTVALDAGGGDVVWEFDAGYSDPEQEYYGTAAPPAVESGVVVTTLGGPAADRFDGGAAVVGLDAEGGAVLWHHSVESYVYRRPATTGGVAVVGTTSGDCYGVDLATGELLWDRSGKAGEDLTFGPVAGDGVAYVVDQSRRVVALEARTGTERWRTPIPDGGPGNEPVSIRYGGPRTLAVANDLVLANNGYGRVFALDAATGSERWRYRAIDRVADTAVDGDRVAVVDQTRTVHILALGRGKRRQWFRTNEAEECDTENRRDTVKGIEWGEGGVYTAGLRLVRTPLPEL